MSTEEQTANQIDQASAESFIAEKHIGVRIKKLRLKRSMGLVDLGRHTGLSASFLSQLETGRVVPTLRNLARIAMVFGKDLSYFFESEPHTLFRIHRKKERVRLPQTGVDDPTYYFESMGYMVPDRYLDPYYAEFVPLKKNLTIRPHVHPGYEFLYVLEGELEIRHGDGAHVLESGDGVYFDASTPHSYRCAGKTPATALIVTMHQQPHPQVHAHTHPSSLHAGVGARSVASPPPKAGRAASVASPVSAAAEASAATSRPQPSLKSHPEASR
ncbi:MAG TPA: XRE family transcriptional regulator [Acidobacteriaceae bacterium]|nr:XRE family transcriptional regulator [Acidobacteriaceae bacterium]